MASSSAVAVRVGASLKELRLHLCQKSPSSAGVRKFVEEHYVPLKRANPQLPILIRECSGVSPVVWARYEFGREVSLPLDDQTSGQVLSAVKQLALANGKSTHCPIETKRKAMLVLLVILLLVFICTAILLLHYYQSRLIMNCSRLTNARLTSLEEQFDQLGVGIRIQDEEKKFVLESLGCLNQRLRHLETQMECVVEDNSTQHFEDEEEKQLLREINERLVRVEEKCDRLSSDFRQLSESVNRQLEAMQKAPQAVGGGSLPSLSRSAGGIPVAPPPPPPLFAPAASKVTPKAKNRSHSLNNVGVSDIQQFSLLNELKERFAAKRARTDTTVDSTEQSSTKP